MNHPNLCYVFIHTTTELGVVKWGESGYYKTDFGNGFTEKDAIELNQKRGISEKEMEAMVICSMANPTDWDKHYEMLMNDMK